jgi:hypothetical protein
VIAANAYVHARMIFRAPLPNNDISGENSLVTEFLHAEALGF